MEKEQTTTQDTSIVTIKKLLETKKMIIGTEKVVKGLKSGKIKKVFISMNAKTETVDDLNHYAQLSSIDIVTLPIKNDELGIICKKPFNISVLGQI